MASSVAATIYTVWRGQFMRNTIDAPLAPFGLPVSDDNHALAALRNLLEKLPTKGGVVASGLNFLNEPGVASAADRRDILILKSPDEALTRLAGDPFAAAFGHSTRQDDYRWGKLHRVVFTHTLGGPFNIPPAGGLFPPPLPGLDGIPTDGGFGTVDAAIHNLRGDNSNGFMFDHGPAHRFVSEADSGHMRAVTSVPGGLNGVLGSPHYSDLLPGWLTNDAFPLLTEHDDVRHAAASITKFVPVR